MNKIEFIKRLLDCPYNGAVQINTGDGPEELGGIVGMVSRGYSSVVLYNKDTYQILNQEEETRQSRLTRKQLEVRAKYCDKLVEWCAKQPCENPPGDEVHKYCDKCIPCRARLETNQELVKANEK